MQASLHCDLVSYRDGLVPTGCLFLLATPKFPYVPKSRKKTRVLNWPPSEMTKFRTCHPQKMAESLILVSLGWQVLDSAIVWGWQVLDLVISEDSVFLDSGTYGNFGDGKKDQTPCT